MEEAIYLFIYIMWEACLFVDKNQPHSKAIISLNAAGGQSVIATLWPVSDIASYKFSSLFCNFLWKKGVHPSEALVAAKNSMQQDPDFIHWHHWAPYVCIGFDFPLFVKSV